MPTREGPASLEAPRSSQGPRGWVEGVPRAQPAFPVTSLCTDATHRILMCCLSDTHQSDARMVAPRELLSAGKQVTGLLPPGTHVSPALPPAPRSRNLPRPAGRGHPVSPSRPRPAAVSARQHPPALLLPPGQQLRRAQGAPLFSGARGQPFSRRTPSPLAERRPVTGPEGSACSRGPPARGSGVAVSKRQGTCLTAPPAAHTPTAAALSWLPGRSPGWPSTCGRCPCKLEGWHPTLHVGEENVGGYVVPLSRGVAYPLSQGMARQGHAVASHPVLTGAQASH